MTDDIASRVLAAIARTAGVPAEGIAPDAAFEQLGMDSLSAIALVGELEEEFGVSIPNEEVLQIRRVDQAVDALRRHLTA